MTTLNSQVGASSDDARENAGTVGLTAASINAGGATHRLGFRWPNVTVPNGATITSATLSLYVTSTANDTPNGATVGMQAADNAATFTTGTNDISGRTRTSTVAWSGSNIGDGWKTLDLTSQVQEVVNRSGWTSGNAMAAILAGVVGSNLTVTAWDGTPSQAAKLDIVYTVASGGMAVKAAHYARMRQGG